jgi:hypothetical protein
MEVISGVDVGGWVTGLMEGSRLLRERALDVVVDMLSDEIDAVRVAALEACDILILSLVPKAEASSFYFAAFAWHCFKVPWPSTSSG